MRRVLAFGLVLLASSGTVRAEDICASVVNGELVRFDRATILPDSAGVTRRERLLAWPGRRWDGLRGRDPECDSATMITYLSRTVPADEIDGYCLSKLETVGFLLIPGARNFRGRCTGSVCKAVNTTRDTALAVSGATARAVTGRGDLSGLVHSSGAAILTGQSTTITSTLGSIGSGLAAALSTPAVAAAAAVSVVAIGGAVYVCRD